MRKTTCYLLISVTIIVGCNQNQTQEGKQNELRNLLNENQELKTENDTLSSHYIALQEENASLHEDIANGMDLVSRINKNLDFITTLERPMIYPTDVERQSIESKIFSNIRLIEQYIKNTDYLIRQLRDSTAMIPHFEDYIMELTKKLEEKNFEVQNLKNQVKSLEYNLGKAEGTIKTQKDEIERLNRKMIIFVSKKETAILEADQKQIRIPFKFTKKDILTDHPQASYSIMQPRGREMVLEIHNKDRFWNDGNYMIIKVNRKELKSLL